MSKKMSFEEWITYGITEEWCSFPVCETHDGLPMTPEMEQEWEQGQDPCMFAIRLWTRDDLPKL